MADTERKSVEVLVSFTPGMADDIDTHAAFELGGVKRTAAVRDLVAKGLAAGSRKP